ncbi:MAG: cupredoxin domain-containing protein [Nitriliruptoraceae bacterium]
MRRDIGTVGGLVGLVAGLALTSCVRDPGPPDASDADDVVVMQDIRYEPRRLEVPRGEVVRLRLTNDGGIVHDLVVDDWESGEVPPGRTAVVELGPFDQTVVGWCSVPGHRGAGMELEIAVTP